ncbi:MIF4-like, type 1/2/3 domain and Armadillo-type fold domain-containing protein [Aphelenchoides bicaudatus]|nr:MIF4-like, type 1/2/3 domain and Armadillo-type fold domain-containing protein [Aphelenchoides bicaudatus]
MLENQLRNILNSLSYLSAQGDVPVQAFTNLISNANTKLLAENLHQRWLSDHNFGHVAAKILSFSHNEERRDMQLCSQVLQLILDDYRNRYELRQDDNRMFRNYCRTLIELLPVYLQIDLHMGHGLVKPLFDSVNLLIDGAIEEEDFICMGQILVRSGNLLSDLCQVECDKLVIKTRKALCFHDRKLGSYSRFIMLNAIDLWTYKWNIELMPECLYDFYTTQYAEFNLNDYDERRWLPLGIKGRIESQSSLVAASSATRLSSKTVTPDPSVETESFV